MPRKVLLVGYQAARRVLPAHSCKFSRHDFTWPIINQERAEKMSDVLAGLLRRCRAITVAIDSTYFDTHHHSRHYEYRCRQHASQEKKTADARRAGAVKRTPKLALAVDSATHMILAARTRVGMSGDALDFVPLLRQSCARVRSVSTVVADSAHDSHVNHVTAREELGVHSLIKAEAGRDKPATSKYRRPMKRELAGSQAGKPYGKRR